MKIISCLIIGLLWSTFSFSQIEVKGRVTAGKLGIQGVNVLEKGTTNGTITSQDGSFLLNVSDPNATLVFQFIGMVSQEVDIKDDNYLLVSMKEDCNKCFFDSRLISIYAMSGLINNPYGGLLDINSPWFIGGLIKGSYTYQTDLSTDNFKQLELSILHYITNCSFDMDFRYTNRNIIYNKQEFTINAVEADFNTRNLKLIAGVSHLRFTSNADSQHMTSKGVSLGVGTYIGWPLHPSIIGKVTLYKDNIEYQMLINGEYKQWLFFIKAYKISIFSELSLGVGARLAY